MTTPVSWWGMPAVLSRIDANVSALLKQGKLIMAKEDDLTAAVDELATNVAAADAAIQKEIAALQAALAANNPAAVTAAIARIKAASTSLATDTVQLTSSLPAT